MSIIATALKHLIAAGVAGDALVDAIADIEAQMVTTDPVAEKRRAYDRERKRAAKAAQSTGIPPESAESTESADAALSLDKSPPDPQKLIPIRGVNITRAREAGPFPRPDWADPQHWIDFLANRKRKSLPNTATAHKRFLADIEKWTDDEWPPWRLLEHAAAKGWAAIYNPRESDNGPKRIDSMGGHRGQADPRGRTLAAGAAFVAAGH